MVNVVGPTQLTICIVMNLSASD